MSRWFRLYDEMLDDPKVQKLHPALFKVLVNVWCVASRHDGRLPSHSDLSFALRMTEDETFRAVSKLAEAGLIDTDSATGEQRPHAWDQRQFRSDVSTDRVRAHRKRQKTEGNDGKPPPGVKVTGGHLNGECNGHETFHGTSPDTEAETDNSVANATGTVVPFSAAAFCKAVFDSAIPVLTATGRTEREARSVIGRWRKALGGNAQGDADLLTLIREADNKSEPLEWLTAAVETRNGNRTARQPNLRGSRPDPSLDLLRASRAAQAEDCPPDHWGDHREARIALPSEWRG